VSVMFLCMFVCVFVFVCLCMWLGLCGCLDVCVLVCVCFFVCVCVCVWDLRYFGPKFWCRCNSNISGLCVGTFRINGVSKIEIHSQPNPIFPEVTVLFSL